MNNADLGFDAWFQKHADELLQPGQHIARVTAVDRGVCFVKNKSGEVSAELTGVLRYGAESTAEFPCVGDWVCVQYFDDEMAAVVHRVFPRRTSLRRKCAGKGVDYQMIGANIDVAFIVQSCHYDFNVRRLERYVVMANDGHIEPVIVLSKTDLITPEELEQRILEIREAGITACIRTLSNIEGTDVDAFKADLQSGQTYCLLGSSGVGKTTLINRLIGRDVFFTKPVSETGEGTHATVRRQLIVLESGALIMDTPGMRELGILGADDGLEESFDDISELAQECRFSDCTHTNEPGCAILKAIKNGVLRKKRYQSYLKLRQESEFNQLSYVDRRKKDRAFGRFIKSVQKHKKR